MSDKYNRYHKIAKIGSGGMGDVFRVIDLDLERECAMKCVPLQQSAEDGIESFIPSRRLSREVSIMASIHDPNVVHIYDHFHHENQLCIVMELCQVSIADWVGQKDPFSLLTTLDMGVQILSALKEIHTQGIVHRDIKPHNILVGLNGKAFKLTDFGLASLRDASMVLTQSGVLAGTVAFMAPEQRLSFKDVTPQADLYSLAMTMQWVLFGELKGDLFSSRTMMLLTEEIKDREWPIELLDFFEHAGAESLADRYQSAQKMQTALEEIVRSLDGERYTRLTPIDFQSVHRYESQLSSASKPIQSVSTVSTEQLQVQTNRWIKGAVIILVVMLLTVLGLSIQVLSLSPEKNSMALQESTSDIPACEQIIETQHQFRRLGPRETVAAGLLDVDGDGFVDSVYSNQMDQSISIYWGNADHALDSFVEIEVGRINQLPLIGDLNRDGLVDFMTLHEDESNIQTHLQTVDRTWEVSSKNFQAPPPRQGALVDLNQDGWLDVMFTVPILDQNIQYRLGSKDGFMGHSPLGSVPNVVFVPNQPWVAYVDGDRILRRDVRRNLSMSTPTEVSRVSDLKRLLPVELSDGEWMLYGIQAGSQKLIELSSSPCWKMQLSDEEYGRMKGLGDWNQDGIIDWVGLVTCAECTSNHLLYINGVPSVVP